jgi:PleD family two-component response regulator
LSVATSSGVELSVTFSAGVAQHRPGEPIDSLIERADKALYCAKSEGRDRTMVDRTPKN